jgi:hypothetical protein
MIQISSIFSDLPIAYVLRIALVCGITGDHHAKPSRN